MALAKTITTPFGIEITDAYHRVEDITISNKTEMNISLAIYADKTARPVSTRGFLAVYDIAGENPIKQAYEHLKTLPEFAGAADV